MSTSTENNRPPGQQFRREQFTVQGDTYHREIPTKLDLNTLENAARILGYKQIKVLRKAQFTPSKYRVEDCVGINHLTSLIIQKDPKEEGIASYGQWPNLTIVIDTETLLEEISPEEEYFSHLEEATFIARLNEEVQQALEIAGTENTAQYSKTEQFVYDIVPIAFLLAFYQLKFNNQEFENIPESVILLIALATQTVIINLGKVVYSNMYHPTKHYRHDIFATTTILHHLAIFRAKQFKPFLLAVDEISLD